MKTIYLIRHGQSDCNSKKAYSRYDSPLTDLGRKQAHDIAERCTKLSLQALISSPQVRAKDTADIIAAATGLSVEVSDLFVERKKPTGLGGEPYNNPDNPEIREIYNEWIKSLNVPGMKVKDGESHDTLLDRVDSSLEFLREHPADELVVVTHSFYIRSVVARILLGDMFSSGILEHFFKSIVGQVNTGITVITFDPDLGQGWKLMIYNDHTHLA